MTDHAELGRRASAEGLDMYDTRHLKAANTIMEYRDGKTNGAEGLAVILAALERDALAPLRTENERLRAALEWAIEHTNLDYQSDHEADDDYRARAKTFNDAEAVAFALVTDTAATAAAFEERIRSEERGRCAVIAERFLWNRVELPSQVGADCGDAVRRGEQ